MKLAVTLAILGFSSIHSSPLSRGRRLNQQRSPSLITNLKNPNLLLPGESEDSDIYQEPNDECDYDEPEIFKDAEPAAEPIAPIPAADYNDNEVIDEEPPCYDEEIDNLDADEFDEID